MAFIVNVVIGWGTIGSIIALILTGHLTWPIVLIYGVSVLAAGVELTRSKIQTAIKDKVDIPGWSRFSLVNDSQIEAICEWIKPELQEVLRKQLTANQEAFDELIEKVEQELKLSLDTKAQEAVIWIQ